MTKVFPVMKRTVYQQRKNNKHKNGKKQKYINVTNVWGVVKSL